VDLSGLAIRGELRLDEPMSRHTSLKTGGNAELFFIPEDNDDLKEFLRWLHLRNLPWLAVGKGYDILCRDGGVSGAVISLERFNSITFESDRVIRAEAGVENLELVRTAQKNGLGGISFISGIPGTIGGAVRMNAGAYGKGILDYVLSIDILRNGEIIDMPIDSVNYGYRFIDLEQDDFVLSALFKLEEVPSEITEDEIEQDAELRRSKHNVGFPSAGSFFKNPIGTSAWKLIDEAGLRGTQVGGAQVSTVHSNFLVNTGKATAADFIQLAALVKSEVFEKSGILLQEEVKIVGEDL